MTATIGRFSGVQSIVSDGVGGFVAQDYSNHIIRSYSGPSATLTTIAGQAGIAGYANGAATAALFRSPNGVTSDGAGGFFVADYGNNVVRRMTATATGFTVSTFAGGNISGGYACVAGGQGLDFVTQ